MNIAEAKRQASYTAQLADATRAMSSASISAAKSETTGPRKKALAKPQNQPESSEESDEIDPIEVLATSRPKKVFEHFEKKYGIES